jgi:hypothetical protein
MHSSTVKCNNFLEQTLTETQPRHKQKLLTEKLFNTYVMAAQTKAYSVSNIPIYSSAFIDHIWLRDMLIPEAFA